MEEVKKKNSLGKWKKKKKKNQAFTFVEAFVEGERNVPRFTSFIHLVGENIFFPFFFFFPIINRKNIYLKTSEK